MTYTGKISPYLRGQSPLLKIVTSGNRKTEHLVSWYSFRKGDFIKLIETITKLNDSVRVDESVLRNINN